MRIIMKEANVGIRLRQVGPLLLVATLALFLGCDGDNLFGSSDPSGTDRGPTITIIDPGDDARTVAIGDSVEVEVEIEDAAGIESVELVGVAFRPDPTLGPDTEVTRYEPQVITFEEPFPRETTVRRRLFPTSDDTSEQVHFVATAVNTSGFESTASTEVSVGGPDIKITSPRAGLAIQSGGPLRVHIEASYDEGISSLELVYSSDFMEGSETHTVSPAEDSVSWTTEIELPEGTSGALRLQALAHTPVTVNPGRSSSVTVNVQTTAAPDDEPPFVQLAVDAPERMEVTDSVQVRLVSNDGDGTGIKRLGITAIATNSAGETVTTVLDTVFPDALRGEVIQDFSFAPFNVRPELPDTMMFEVFAFAYDDAEEPNCAVGVESREQQLTCVEESGGVVTKDAAGMDTDRVVVTAGRTVLLPDGGTIADAVVDTMRQRLYLSNISRNRVDVLELAGGNPFEFLAGDVDVGAQPWGLFLGGGGDTLVVANSGGTNISFVSLDGTPSEDKSRRLRTPNTVLYEIKVSVDQATGNEKLSGEFIDFSDRPQFIAQDSMGRFLYSTVPTQSAADGTIRVAYTDPSFESPEVKLLLDGGAVGPGEGSVVIANVDSLKVYKVDGGHDEVEIFDHVFGHPSMLIQSGRQRLMAAIDSMEGQGSDIFSASGSWVPQQIGFSDTTFVSASGDGGRIAFGEGATSPTGRIILWNAEDEGVSHEVAIADLLSNASERVTGVALNQNGSFGVARGEEGAYFFTPDLRLQGLFADGLEGGGAGAALHPGHDALTADEEVALSFVGTNRNTIQIIGTNHFKKVGEVEIRDRIVGPLRSSAPLPDDNAGRSCPGDPDCVVAKVYGVTSAGGAVVIDVRERDMPDL